MNREEFQERLGNYFAERLPAAAESVQMYCETPVTHHLWRSYYNAMLEALADILTELGLLTSH